MRATRATRTSNTASALSMRPPGGVAADSFTVVQMLRCPRCHDVTVLETLECPGCGLAVGFHPPTLTMREATRGGVDVDGRTWVPCSNRGWGCNWLVAEDVGAARCLSCRLNRQRPDASDTMALEKLSDASRVMRRLIVQLAELGLPVDPFYEREGGVAFDLLSSDSGQGRVTIGHANGVITIDLIETLDDYREALRIRLGEPYRTMLGHFRHEVGHYYQWILVEQTGWIDECRELFGDERASYSEAIDRHYREGAPEGWDASYISEYATMHPWEDFAECFAHYLHITDSLTTAAAGGLVLQADRLDGLIDADVAPRRSYQDASTSEMLGDWQWLSLLLNRINHAMGRSDLYPFTITEPVRTKLDFVHRVVRDVAGRNSGQPVLACLPLARS
jgi:hypothetical protein